MCLTPRKGKAENGQTDPWLPARKNRAIRNACFKAKTPKDSVIYAAYTSTLAERALYIPELVLFPSEKDGSGFFTASSASRVYSLSLRL
jgi:hypothetical protein